MIIIFNHWSGARVKWSRQRIVEVLSLWYPLPQGNLSGMGNMYQHLGSSMNTDSIRQATGIPFPNLWNKQTNKQTNDYILNFQCESNSEKKSWSFKKKYVLIEKWFWLGTKSWIECNQTHFFLQAERKVNL